MRLVALTAVVLLAASCRSGPEEVGGNDWHEGDFRATGAVALSGRIPLTSDYATGASFNGRRVVGPRVDVSKRPDGSWAGRVYDQPIDVSASGEQITGSSVSLRVKTTDQGMVVGGTFLGGSVRIVLDDKQIVVTSPQRSFTLARTGPGRYGDEGQLRLDGEAAQLRGPQPQLALALLGTI